MLYLVTCGYKNKVSIWNSETCIIEEVNVGKVFNHPEKYRNLYRDDYGFVQVRPNLVTEIWGDGSAGTLSIGCIKLTYIKDLCVFMEKDEVTYVSIINQYATKYCPVPHVEYGNIHVIRDVDKSRLKFHRTSLNKRILLLSDAEVLREKIAIEYRTAYENDAIIEYLPLSTQGGTN